MSKKVLIAYYSWSGNTRDIAQRIQKITGGDLFEITPEKAYPLNYGETVDIAKHEKLNDYNPPLKNHVSTEDYDVIFVGTPVWWYTMAPVVKTFLQEADFNGKVVVPFCTHGGGGESSTFNDMENLLPPDSELRQSFVCFGRKASDEVIEDWIRKAGVI